MRLSLHPPPAGPLSLLLPGAAPGPPFSAVAVLRSCFRSPPPGVERLALPVLRFLHERLAAAERDFDFKPPRGGAALSCLGGSAPHLRQQPGDGFVAPAPPSLPPGTLLISQPWLAPPFERSVVLLLEHGEGGSSGVVLTAGCGGGGEGMAMGQ